MRMPALQKQKNNGYPLKSVILINFTYFKEQKYSRNFNVI